MELKELNGWRVAHTVNADKNPFNGIERLPRKAALEP